MTRLARLRARAGPVRLGALVSFLAWSAPLPAQSIDLPPRPGDARGAATLLTDLRGLSLDARDSVVLREVLSGNVPAWWRVLVPVEMVRTVAGTGVQVRFWATPDYLAIGSDEDWFLMPLRPETAQQIADATDTSLPTPAMVDAIWHAATARLMPDSIAPTAAMVTLPVFAQHQRLVRGRREADPAPPGALVAGHKKDVVITARLDSLPGRVAIHGWHRPDGTPIQPLYTGHASTHVDYSHGIRLVSRRVLIDGIAHDMLAVLRDPTVAAALSDEGVMQRGRYPTRTLLVEGAHGGDR